MTSELTLLILRIGFLLLLWFFVFGIVYALRSDLFGQRVRKMPADAASAPGRQAPSSPFPPPAASSGGIVMQHPPLSNMPGAAADGPSHPLATTSTAAHLVITSGQKQGTSIDLGREPITIGRSAESGLVIRDDYTSTHHARLMLWNDTWMLQDLDSTNGTFLDGKRVTSPAKIPLDTPIKIGTTTFELRR
ncbi:FHA domain-containing protein [Microbacterium sp. STN6]|uniref:FHA domain-containing protein FhaB/FipA n=1 Tax=Microbacterium sp. STN6 TaxID=2995588 RepID=UPI0022609BF4|nr:FHA domain-containing protein [Microbacterium sp. STN6]MCX7522737.1 FHA domain-containing protein [Microbacterium sp. STN6]